MIDDIVQEIWDRGKSQKKDLSAEEIEQTLRPDVRRQSFAIQMYIWIWLVVLVGTFVLDVLNIGGYSGNPVMVVVQTWLTILAVIFAGYGVHLLREIRVMDRADESLIATLTRRRRFYRTKFEFWNLIMAASIVLMTFAVTSYVDNKNGYYSIGRVELFILFSALQFAFMYGINKIAQYPIRKEMKIFLSDLEANVMDGTQTLGIFRKRWRRWAVVFFIVGIVLLLFGLWRAMQFGS